MNHPIDIVVPWVDGSDPAWLKEKAGTLNLSNGDQRVNRYRDWGLLPYWFRGVEKFLPWVRTIHFITWGHLPKWLNVDHPRLNIVNHKDFIPMQYLPVFSCNPIELNFHRIEGLSEQFIYANDDTFFIRPVEPEFFFRDGLPVDAAIENVLQFFRTDGISHMVANDLECINTHFRKKEVVAMHRKKWYHHSYGKAMLKNLYLKPFSNFTGFEDPHLPNAFLKETYREVWAACGDRLDNTCRHKVRNNEDVNQWLLRYWQFATGKFTPGNPNRGLFLVLGKDDALIRSALIDPNAPMICISDDFPDIDVEKEQTFLTNSFERLLSEKSSFEI